MNHYLYSIYKVNDHFSVFELAHKTHQDTSSDKCFRHLSRLPGDWRGGGVTTCGVHDVLSINVKQASMTLI